MSRTDQPVFTLVAGVNGAGKSTINDKYGVGSGEYINPDDIAKEIAPDDVNNPRVALAAGREAINRINEAFESGDSFSQESTLSSKQPINTLKKANDLGYETNLLYVGLENKEQSVARVIKRVQAGGHDIPIDALERRYDKSMENLPQAMLAANHVTLVANEENGFKQLYVRTGEQEVFRSEELPEWASTALKSYDTLANDKERQDFIEAGKQCILETMPESQHKALGDALETHIKGLSDQEFQAMKSEKDIPSTL